MLNYTFLFPRPHPNSKLYSKVPSCPRFGGDYLAIIGACQCDVGVWDDQQLECQVGHKSKNSVSSVEKARSIDKSKNHATDCETTALPNMILDLLLFGMGAFHNWKLKRIHTCGLMVIFPDVYKANSCNVICKICVICDKCVMWYMCYM